MTAVPSLLTEWARLLLATLEQAGVETAVISPGSRSTPLAFAALSGGMRCISVVDERVAAFFAVGHARMTGRPVVLICTSGSAAANYFPALVEAARACVPLLVLTADRPFELQDSDAPQTIDQVRLYGGFTRAYLDPGMPDPHPDALAALQRTGAQAVHRTLWPLPGPVHVNVRARKPLEPARGTDAASAALRERVDALIGRGPTRAAGQPGGPAAEELAGVAESCVRARRGVIVSGPVGPAEAAPDAVIALARRTGFALLPEATGQLRFQAVPPDVVVLDSFDALLRSEPFRRGCEPDVALEIGAPATSSAWRDYVATHPRLARHVFSPRGWSDPAGSAATIVQGPLRSSLAALLRALEAGGTGAPDRDWLAWLGVARDAAWGAVDRVLAAEAGFDEGRAVRAVVESIPSGAVLALGNSLPVREVDTFCRAADRGIAVWSQRGASGIDGLIAGAAGAASASGRATILVLGDVSFLHDVGGLAVARDAGAPLVVVVLDNGGGRIFDRLPLGSSAEVAPEARRFWSTPPGLDLEHAAAAFGVAYRRTPDPDTLAAAVREAAGGPAVTTVIVAALVGDRTDPQQAAVRAETDAAVRDLPPPPPRPA